MEECIIEIGEENSKNQIIEVGGGDCDIIEIEVLSICGIIIGHYPNVIVGSSDLDSTMFNKNLSINDDTIQKAFETLDQQGNDYLHDFLTGLQ